jgi:hypothetical protein
VRVACQREGVEGEEEREPRFDGCEAGPEAFDALELGGGVGESGFGGYAEAVLVDCKCGGDDMELQDCWVRISGCVVVLPERGSGNTIRF